MPPTSPPPSPFPHQSNLDDLLADDPQTGLATSSSRAHAHAQSNANAKGPSAASSSSSTLERITRPRVGSPGDIEMESVTRGHRRRRSSILNPIVAPTRARARSVSQAIPLQDEVKIIEEGDGDEGYSGSGSGGGGGGSSGATDFSEGSASDDDLHDDEETGLTRKERERRRQRKARNTLLDQRIAPEKAPADEKGDAHDSMVKTLLINAGLIGLWYIFSLSISLYNKWMFDHDRLNFRFPLFTTSAHMLIQFALSSLVLYFIPTLRPYHRQGSDSGRSRHEPPLKHPVMTKWYYISRIAPCGLATGLDIGLGNTSLQFITLTFYTMCKSSSLAFVLIFAFLFRLETPTLRLISIIAVMTIGVVMMVFGEVKFHLGGFALVVSAAFFSGFRWALTQILLLRNPATSNAFSSIFFLAPVMFLVLITLGFIVEGFSELLEGIKLLQNEWGTFSAPAFLLFPGCIAFLMTASEFALLKRTSVVTLSIAGIFKEVVTISAAAVVFEDRLTFINFIGLVTTMAAIIAYNWFKISRMRRDARESAQGKLESGGRSRSTTPRNGVSDADDDEGEDAGLLGGAQAGSARSDSSPIFGGDERSRRI
ncbi:related to vanadate resistance protein Gog5p, member of the triose phosphate translocater family [Cephalotrichum gorgonifer]|uniref:Related to vanadate resistance protein Gog5p, member of the triose phosphate translocater family n=1 Tax=Cephalotrichum gorgonifer TaxID=2041049 RepID=A0AAE8MQ76_9PEZI|nr:related to vanadate resistance protein Gog5p, member of the triose phosphate translocater family [Cephalotrichum gorgonifer]